MSKDCYAKMTDADFDHILEHLISEMSAAQILAYGEVNAFFREELNNEVLEEWEREEDSRNQFYLDIMTTAAEGGIDYWADIKNWRTIPSSGDTRSFECRDFEDKTAPWQEINVEKVKAVIEKIVGTACSIAISDTIRQAIISAYLVKDAGEIDAEAADVIVQVAAFGEIVYG